MENDAERGLIALAAAIRACSERVKRNENDIGKAIKNGGMGLDEEFRS